MTNYTFLDQKRASKKRLLYIDNLRIFLTILVIIHHLIVGYGGASGRWYYNDPGQIDGFSWYVMTFFWLLNQSFFMGFLFMLSSYFSPGSYKRKGANVYIKERLIRLGIPLCIYIIVVNPILAYVAWIQKAGFEGSFWQFLPQYIKFYNGLDVGVLWFVEVLLIFSFAYVLWQWLSKYKIIKSWKICVSTRVMNRPSNAQIFWVALGLGILVFADRMLFVENKFLQLLGLPNGHFIQYVVLLSIGMLAYQYNWFSELTKMQGKIWTGVALGLLLVLPGILIAAGIMDGNFSPYSAGGGWDWRSLLAFSIWEQFMCVAIIISLLVWCREKLNFQTNLTKTMASNTYAVYVVHTPVLTLLIFALRNVMLESVIKCILVTPIAIAFCFLVGHIVRQLPFAKQIL
ncbi:acyltransferase family protein [Nodosilinea nodulosa]|uniref:acyltransferase family protein n=1 Tax=Nodosilinea nodulosa TaxID=416001 RepID=UPI0002EA6248|nr:acyltransferase [Nodosilinea nodulosa]